MRDRMVRIDQELLDALYEAFPEWKGLKNKGLVDVALRKLLENKKR